MEVDGTTEKPNGNMIECVSYKYNAKCLVYLGLLELVRSMLNGRR